MRRPVIFSLVSLVCVGAAPLRETTIAQDAFACVSWAAWHEYTLASLTKKGGRISRLCPLRLAAGTKIKVVEEDDGSGASTITYKGKTWVVDNQRVK